MAMVPRRSPGIELFDFFKLLRTRGGFAYVPALRKASGDRPAWSFSHATTAFVRCSRTKYGITVTAGLRG